MPIEKPEKTYANEDADIRGHLDVVFDRLMEWIRGGGHVEARALLRAMGDSATRQEWIAMYDEGVIGLGRIGAEIGFVFYDENQGKYLPFGPVLGSMQLPESN